MLTDPTHTRSKRRGEREAVRIFVYDGVGCGFHSVMPPSKWVTNWAVRDGTPTSVVAHIAVAGDLGRTTCAGRTSMAAQHQRPRTAVAGAEGREDVEARARNPSGE